MAPQVNHEPPTPPADRIGLQLDGQPRRWSSRRPDPPRPTWRIAALLRRGRGGHGRRCGARRRRRAHPDATASGRARRARWSRSTSAPTGGRSRWRSCAARCATRRASRRSASVSMHAQLVQLLTNRLLVEAYLRAPPRRARRAGRTAPIVMAGLPRTGTTHLHNLLSADPALRSLPYWEAVEPLPAPGDGGGTRSSPASNAAAFGLDMSAAVDARDAAHARDDAVAHPRGDPPAGAWTARRCCSTRSPRCPPGGRTTARRTRHRTTGTCTGCCRCSSTPAAAIAGCSRAPSTWSSSDRCRRCSPTRRSC